MRSLVAQIMGCLLMMGICAYNFIREPVRSEFSDQMVFWSIISFVLIFFAYDVYKSSKEYEKAINQFIK
jgi:UDP-N-acetylmuramyl pentapeptide phosphotransferase/UDP-N-acetylglucosamine-1-phosphate transferase